MSGGEQQRVGLARAIVHRPRVLLADEPTGNLDPDSEKQVMELLKKINVEYDTTVIVVTHRSTVAKYGSQIIKMDKGSVI